MVRTSGPSLPSGRRFASTCHRDPSEVRSEQARASSRARADPMTTSSSSSADPPRPRPAAGATTCMTSTSEMKLSSRAPVLPIAITAQRTFSCPSTAARAIAAAASSGGVGEIADRRGDLGLERRRRGGHDIRGGDLHQALVVGDAQRIAHLARARPRHREFGRRDRRRRPPADLGGPSPPAASADHRPPAATRAARDGVRGSHRARPKCPADGSAAAPGCRACRRRRGSRPSAPTARSRGRIPPGAAGRARHRRRRPSPRGGRAHGSPVRRARARRGNGGHGRCC